MTRRNRPALVRTPRKVFVCGTHEDLLEERQAAIDAIESLGHQPIAMEKFFAAPSPPVEECCRRVRESDFLILIVGDEYGSRAPNSDLSYSQIEYNEAQRKSIPTLVYLLVDEGNENRNKKQDPKDWERLIKFKKILTKRHTWGPFDNSTTLAEDITDRLDKTINKHLFPRGGVLDQDEEEIQNVFRTKQRGIWFYRPDGTGKSGNRVAKTLHMRAFELEEPYSMTDLTPMLESFGFRVIERKTASEPGHAKREAWWAQDFELGVLGKGVRLSDVSSTLKNAVAEAWSERIENDAFNRLVLAANLTWREVELVRAYGRYLVQTELPFSLQYIEEAVINNAELTQLLVREFKARFDPQQRSTSNEDELAAALDSVENRDEYEILRAFSRAISGTLRTNYFCSTQQGDPKPCISLKMDSRNVPELPSPRSRFETFVYSPRVEGILMRGERVARGGLHRSDRKEGFRAEALDLLKAQNLKNAVTIPAGASGAFVARQLSNKSREEQVFEIKYCYETFISGLLDITDNFADGTVVGPSNVIRYDADDPYLVVDAGRGTADFADIANEVSSNYNFWLEDAFASGGSQGYDHDKTGITARGAWESVKRHFRCLGKNIQKEEFTVVGIGDMSGGVFGNGMLASPCIQLVAAFNHTHIFVDPVPNTARSYKERQRLFSLPRSTWNDYDKKLISKGGGVFSRQAKRIDLTPQMQQMLNRKEKHLTPNELIACILKAQVDLIWNGGIGTYIKASNETDSDVSDKSNDAIRINGRQVRAIAIGEGGNLGVSQRGRVEYALAGGLIYTDSIDNSAGVDCSDNEVNIKILLSQLVKSNRLGNRDRNQLLDNMTDEVGQKCLFNNYRQTQVIDSSIQHAARNMPQHARFMSHLERAGILNRKLEDLPDDKQITQRIRQSKKELTRPELSILLSYTKLTYKSALLESSSLSEECYNQLLLEYFPRELQELYADEILLHPLRKEIIATLLSNMITNNLGIGFNYRIHEETGASSETIAKAYIVCVKIFDLDKIWGALEKLDNVVHEEFRYECFRVVGDLLERSINWLLRNKGNHLDVNLLVERYKQDIEILRMVLRNVVIGQSRKKHHDARRRFVSSRLPRGLAQELADITMLASAFDIIEIKSKRYTDTESVARVFYALSERLQLHWLRDAIPETIATHWHHLAIVNMYNDIYAIQINLTELLLLSVANKRQTTKAFEWWEQNQAAALERYDHLVNELRALQPIEFSAVSVAVSEARRLTSLTQQSLKCGD